MTAETRVAHTAGPWTLRWLQGDALVIPASDEHKAIGFSIYPDLNRERYAAVIANVRPPFRGDRPETETEANARLIVTAPRMYDELIRLRGLVGVEDAARISDLLAEVSP